MRITAYSSRGSHVRMPFVYGTSVAEAREMIRPRQRFVKTCGTEDAPSALSTGQIEPEEVGEAIPTDPHVQHNRAGRAGAAI